MRSDSQENAEEEDGPVELDAASTHTGSVEYTYGIGSHHYSLMIDGKRGAATSSNPAASSRPVAASFRSGLAQPVVSLPAAGVEGSKNHWRTEPQSCSDPVYTATSPCSHGFSANFQFRSSLKRIFGRIDANKHSRLSKSELYEAIGAAKFDDD